MQNHENFTFVPNDHVSHSLMCRVLGVWTKSVPALCTSQRINECSRRKPYNFGDPGEQLYGETGTYESKLLQNNFGMVPAIISKPANGATTAAGLVGQWGQWQPPQPGHAKRLDDFRMYWHLATEHVKSVEYSSGAKPSLMPYTADFWAKVTFTSEYVDRIVTLSDMSYGGKYIGDMYLTVAIASHNAYGVWGEQWIIAQSAKTLRETILPPLSGGLGKDYIDVNFNLFKANISNLVDKFGDHFIAVGFASKLLNQTSLTTNSGSLYYLSQPNGAMPLALVSPDMYNNSMQLAAIGKLLLAPSAEVEMDVRITKHTERYEDYSLYASLNYKDGGCEISLRGKLRFDVDSVVPDSAKNDGYFVFYINITNHDGRKKSFAVIMEKGFYNEIDIFGVPYFFLNLSNYGMSTEPATADTSTGDAKDALQWLKSKHPEDDIEILTSQTVFCAGLTDISTISVEVMGAPSGWTANNAFTPNIKLSNTSAPWVDEVKIR